MKPLHNLLFLSLTVACALGTGYAQDTPSAKTPPAPSSTTGAPTTGYRKDILGNLDDTQKKLISLAEAIPEDKFKWRPAEGVRSIGEVYMHIAGANYLFATPLGAKAPAGMGRDMETKVTAKADIIDALKKSFDHVRQAILNVPDSDVDKDTKFFNRTTSNRNILMLVLTHLHEHFGQSIAYARMNGIVPPWSVKRES